MMGSSRAGFDDGSGGRGSLVGRVLERAFLDARVERSRHVVVLGESGVGKSALVADWVNRSTVVSLCGWCVPLLEPTPLLAVVTALGSRDPAVRSLVQSALSRMPPGLASVLPPALPQIASSTAPALVSGEDRLFLAIGELLAEMACEHPVALVVEDVHWADQHTLDLLTYLMLGRRDPGVAVVCTFRQAEPSGPDRGQTWLAKVLTSAQVDELALQPLTRTGFEEQLKVLAPDISEEPAERIFARSEGNPFITQELVSSWRATGEVRSTATLTAMLGERIDAIAQPGLTVLDVLAHVGRPLGIGQLNELLDIDQDQVRAALAQLVNVGLVIADDELRLRHALVREAVLARFRGMPSRVESRLAGMLERSPNPDVAGESAAHYAHAGDWRGELRMAARAAERAWELTAYADAASWGQRAFEIRSQHPDDWAPGIGQNQLIRRTLTSLELTGDRESRLRFAELAWQQFIPWGDPAERGDVLSQAACTLMMTEPRVGFGYANHVITDPAVPDSGPKAMVLMSLAMGASAMGDLSGARNILTDAEAMAAKAGDYARAAACVSWRAVLERGAESAAKAQSLLARGQQYVDRADSVDAAVQYAGMASALWATMGQLRHGLAVSAAGVDLARGAGLANSTAGTLLRANAAMCALELGSIDDAAAFIEPAVTSPQRTEDYPASVLKHVRARLALTRGQIDVTALAPRRAATGMFGLARENAELIAETLLWAERPEEAWRVATSAIENLLQPTAALDRPIAGQLLTLAARAAADLATAEHATTGTSGSETPLNASGDHISTATALRGRFSDEFGEDPLTAKETIARIRADALMWSCEIGRAGNTDHSKNWQATASAWTELGAPHRAAYAQWRAAQAAIRQAGGVKAAVTALKEARRLAAGHRPLETAIDDLAGRLHVSGWHVLEIPQPDFSPLTTQERRVLGLLALGWTNRQIATELYVSPKTASVHVSHILQKLQVPTRGAAANWAHAAGLVGDRSSDQDGQ